MAFLDADHAVAVPVAPVAAHEAASLTVLVVSAEADVRGYVRECLRERTDLRVVDAATVAAAVAMAANSPPSLLIVDGPEGDAVASLSEIRAIVIIDDVPLGGPEAAAHVRLLARPFTAEGLMAEVSRLLG